MGLSKFLKNDTHYHLNENINRDDILSKAKEITNANDYMNCHIFSQRLLDYSDKKKDLSKTNFNVSLSRDKVKNLEKLLVGDLLEFNNISHYSIYIGGDQVIEVEQWGCKPRIISLVDNLKDFEGTTGIYRKK